MTANKAFILGYTLENKTYTKEKESIIFDDFTLDTKFVDFPYMVKSSAIKILTLRDKSTDNLRFNYELLSNTKFNMLGHARHYISVVQPEEVYTTQKAEQDKMADLFSNLDNLITLHQHKYEKLVNMKKSLLEKMFPKNNSNIPEIRFKGFTDVWEQRILSECATFRRGSFPQPYGKSEWYDGIGAMPFVQVADVGNDMRLIDETKQRISKIAQPMSVFVPKDSVIVTLQGTIGRVAITQYNAYLDRTVLYFDSYKNSISKNFWSYIIKNKFLEEAKSAPGGTIKTITKEVLSKFDLKLPQELDEQNKIGECFKQIDSLITLHQRKHDKLIKIKQALLKNMFVQKGVKYE